MKYRVVDYEMATPKSMRDFGDHRQTGLIAQEVYEFCKEGIHVGTNDHEQDPWWLDYGRNVVPFLILAVKQLAARVAVLEGAAK